jgi:anti-sigma-K factor RskA
MKTDDPRLIELLAQRFVLGTQRGAARRRFEALVKEREDARQAVGSWEERLTPLAWGLRPVKPSALLWPRICRELGISSTESETPPDTRATGKPEGGNRLAAVAAGFAVLAIVTAGGWWRSANRPPETVTETVIERVPEAVSVAVVSGDDGRALWLTRIAPASRELTVRVVDVVEQRPANDYELWALTDAGVPVSLGLLPQAGRRTLSLDDEAIAALGTSSTLAVSLEPQGGSPQPTPSGPVLYTAALLAP